MSTSTYTVHVTATSPQDAQDIAKRRARDDGFRVRTVRRVLRVGLPTGTTFVVDLAVDRP